MLTIYCDGSKTNYCIYVEQDQEMYEIIILPNGTQCQSHNESEYLAIIEALRYIEEQMFGTKYIAVVSDSELAIKQIRGEYKIKAQRFLPLVEEVHSFGLPPQSFVWVPREQNKAGIILDKLKGAMQ